MFSSFENYRDTVLNHAWFLLRKRSSIYHQVKGADALKDHASLIRVNSPMGNKKVCSRIECGVFLIMVMTFFIGVDENSFPFHLIVIFPKKIKGKITEVGKFKIVTRGFRRIPS